MPTGDLIRYIFLSLVALVVLAFGFKLWSKHKEGKQIVSELRSHVNPTASFEQFYAADAEKSLYKAMALMHRGEERLNKPPHILLDLAFEKKGTGNILGNSDPTSNYDLDPREHLIRSAFLRNYDNCKRLGVFADTVSREALAKGEAPQISSGPDQGESVRIRYIIDPDVSPGADKIIPNLVISPPGLGGGQADEFGIAQAKALATSLSRAGLIENSARDRIIAHYEQLGREDPAAGDAKDSPAEAPAP